MKIDSLLLYKVPNNQNKKIKSGLVLFISIITLFTSCSPKLHVSKSTWQGTPITVDGSSADWTLPLQYSDPDTKVNYSVSNDQNNLYIFIESNEDATVTGITKNGFQVWIDTTGRKNHQVGILCPFPQRAENPADNNGQRQRRNSNAGNNSQQQYGGIPDAANQSSVHRRFIERTKQIHVSGFKTIPDGLIKLPDTCGISIGVSWDNSNYLLYEVAIPLKSFLKYPILSSDSSKTIGITFNFTSIPKGSNNGNGGSGIHPGFGIGMGMVGFMMDGGGGSNSIPQPQAETIWRPFHLATIPVKGRY